jgi:hypothetical protein
MERFSRILIIIFTLILVNIGLNSYLITKVNKLEKQNSKNIITTQITTTSPTPKPSAKNESQDNNISADLAIIKAEIRSIRESLELTGIVLETPKP